MARRNLSRTAIEGGRGKHNKFERRHSSQVERVNAKVELNGAHGDSDVLGDIVFKKREVVYKDFRDKLAPVYRWLDTQVGRNWNKVRSEVMSRFDSRTTAGRHILFDHLLSSVVEEGAINRYPDWVVDKQGILRIAEDSYHHRTGVRKRREKDEALPDYARNRVINWLNHRRVGRVGGKMFWFCLTSKRRDYEAPMLVRWNRNQVEYLFEETKTRDIYGVLLAEPRKVWQHMGTSNYRRDVEFSRADRKYFESLPEWVQTMLLKYSPAA